MADIDPAIAQTVARGQGNPVTPVEAARRRQLRSTRISSLQAAIGHLVEAGADDAVQAVFSLLDAEGPASPDATEVRAATTRPLGKIGSQPVHLPAVVPRLITGLLHAEPKVRRAAVRGWADLASQPQPLPSTLFDLLPTLLADGSIIMSVLRLIARLTVPHERGADLLARITQLAYAIQGASFDGSETIISACVGALRALAHGQPEEEAEGPLGMALLSSGRLTAREQRDLLTAWWPRRLANSRLFAERALSVLATAELTDYFNVPDYRVQAALLECPYGTGLQPMDGFTAATDLHLPDHPWPAIEMVEVLQRAARWQDAASIADHITATIPLDREHEARRDLASVIAQLATGEASLAAGATQATTPVAPPQSGQQRMPSSQGLPP
jgi:hypothetical protein